MGIDDAGDVRVAANGVYVYPAGSKRATQISTLTLNNVVMNAGGQIAGTASGHGYSMNVKGQTTDWGVLQNGTITGINASGQIVGTTFDSNSVGHAFVSINGSLTDLNSLVPPGSFPFPGSIFYPRAINDLGQIGAVGTAGSESVLLTPVSG